MYADSWLEAVKQYTIHINDNSHQRMMGMKENAQRKLCLGIGRENRVGNWGGGGHQGTLAWMRWQDVCAYVLGTVVYVENQ